MTDIRSITGRRETVLLDGAHNAQSAQVLGAYVDRKLRSTSGKVTWVVAASGGKELKSLLEPLIRPGDCISTVEFGPVDGMPWVKATDPVEILNVAVALGLDQSLQYNAGSDLSAALRWATETAAGGPLVIAGSLYLVSDVLRLLRKAEEHSSLL
jgi:folylpolyglutamate synthase